MQPDGLLVQGKCDRIGWNRVRGACGSSAVCDIVKLEGYTP
jgi:hypothetical protein